MKTKQNVYPYDAPYDKWCFKFVRITENRHAQVCKNTCFYGDKKNKESNFEYLQVHNKNSIEKTFLA